jgi:hypothetical protein
MKKLFFISAALVMTVCATAQEKSSLDKDITEKEVPAAVMKAFQAKNPGQKVDKWEMKGVNFEADYTKGGKFCEMCMDKTGKLIENETACEKKDVPQAVLDAVAANKEYKDWTFDHCEEVETAKHPKLYEITVKKGTAVTGLYYTPDGKKLVKVEKE